MGAAVCAFDWSATNLGPLDGWPISLRVAVELCLNSRFPMYVWWGADLINIYSDAYAPSIAAKSAGMNLGATFQVRLASVALNRPVESPTHAPALVPGQTSDSPKVLLVEDHPDTSRTMSRLLKNFGFSVGIAHSVTNALQMLDNEKFDVMVSDIGLPDATGYELMQQARMRHGLKGIALSRYGMEEDIQKSREAGFSEHLVEPIDVAQLKELLTKMTAK